MTLVVMIIVTVLLALVGPLLFIGAMHEKWKELVNPINKGIDTDYPIWELEFKKTRNIFENSN